MKWLAVVLVGVGIVWVIRSRRSDPLVSSAWLRDHSRLSDMAGVDQVAISWPIRKITNEAGQWNARRLRKQA